MCGKVGVGLSSGIFRFLDIQVLLGVMEEKVGDIIQFGVGEEEGGMRGSLGLF